MKRKAFLSFCMALALTLLLPGCDTSSKKKSDDIGTLVFISMSDPPVPAPTSVVTACGDITTNTTWTNNNLYVINCSVNVVNVTLTIQRGTIIKIAKDGGNKITYPLSTSGDNGIIKATGTPNAHITFTSYADDTIGGNTDSSSTTPAKGDWGGLWISSDNRSARSTFVYCDFFYGGYNPQNYDYRAMLDLYSCPVTIDHCTFAHSEHAGANLDKIDLDNISPKDENTYITNCIFYDNEKPLFICPNFSMDGSNIFYNPQNTAQTNAYNGIWVMDSTQITSPQSWGNNGVPYVSKTGLVMDEEDTLTLAAGTIIKFGDPDDPSDHSADVGIDKPSNIIGLANAIFTSIKDDNHGGDTNHDGSATSPVHGDWQGIQYALVGGGSDWVSGGNILYAERP
jgi:hypothetical protein